MCDLTEQVQWIWNNNEREQCIGEFRFEDKLYGTDKRQQVVYLLIKIKRANI